MSASPLAFDSPRAQRWFVVGLLLLFAGLSVQYSLKVLTPRKDGYTNSAILRWAPQLQALEAGEDIHRAYNYPNPPIMALLLWPVSELAQLSPLAAALAWFYLKVGLALLAMRWAFRLVETPEAPFPAWAKALAVLLSLRPILGDLSHGNVNIFILFLVVGSLHAFKNGRDFLAGLLLALAIACKVTPALFVGYFLWKGAWRVLAGCAAGLFLFFLGVPALVLGWENNLRDLTSWLKVMVLPYLVGGVVTPEHNNQSLPGLVFRLLTHSPSFSTYVNDVYTPTNYHNFAAIGMGAAKWLVKGFMAAFVLLVVWTCRAPIRAAGKTDSEARRGWRLGAEFGLVLLGMLLFSERTWKHHCVTLLVPVAVLFYGLGALKLEGRCRGWLVGCLVAATLLMASTSTGLLPDDWAKLAQVYGAYVWMFIVLIAGLAVLLRDQRANVAAAGQAPEVGPTLPAARAA